MSDVNVEFCDPFEQGNIFMRLEHCGRYLFAADNIIQTGVTLDCACADGYGCIMLGDIAEKVIGIDINKEYIASANLKNRRDNVSFLVLDCAALSDKFEDSSFSNIVSLETIEHLDFPYSAVQNFCRLLKKGGNLVLSFPNADYEKIENGKNVDIFHKHLIDLNKVKNLLKDNGMENIKVYGQPFTNVLMAVVSEKKRTKLSEKINTPEKIIAKSKKLAYPQRLFYKLSYAFIITAVKS